MTREEYLKQLIKTKGMNIKEFSQLVEIPYSTVLTMLNNNIGGASVDNVIKICKALDVNVESLQNQDITPKSVEFYTDNEKNHIKKYRTLNERGQQTVDTVLNNLYEIAVAQKETTANSLEYLRVAETEAKYQTVSDHPSREEMHRKLDEEIDAVEKGETSSASTPSNGTNKKKMA